MSGWSLERNCSSYVIRDAQAREDTHPLKPARGQMNREPWYGWVSTVGCQLTARGQRGCRRRGKGSIGSEGDGWPPPPPPRLQRFGRHLI